MARRRSGNASEEVETNLTSMLDIIFNVLAFFVVTFNPPKPEKNFDLSLPPPKQQEQQAEAPDETDKPPEIFQDVTITLEAGADGSLAGIRVEDRPVAGIGALARDLATLSKMIGGVPGVGEKLEAANIIAAPTLKYRWVIAVVDSCYQADIKKINFAESNAPPAEN